MSSTRQLEFVMPPERGGIPLNPQSPLSTAVGAASTAAIDTKIDLGEARATKNWITLDTDQDIYICFGESNMGSATSADWRVNAADGPVRFLLDARKTRYFRAVRVTADAIVKTYVSG